MELQDRQTTAAAAPPVVRYGVQRKVAKGKPDYWDYATLVELAVLENDRAAALQALSAPCLAFARNGNRKRRCATCASSRKREARELPALGERN